MPFNFQNCSTQDGANQRRVNPAIQLGAKVHCIPNDVDLLVTDFDTAQDGTICGYWMGEYIDVELHGGKTYTLNIEQITVLGANQDGNC